jgi:radical SAM superfamily enzyme YgiQ (UPF0313 family)
MRILLVSTNTWTTPYPVYPLGVDFVAAALGAAHEVRVLDLCGTQGCDAVLPALEEFRPEVIGISLRNIDNTDALDGKGLLEATREVVALLREHTACPIVLGGSGYALFPEVLLDELGADYGLIGDGERFGELLAAHAHGHGIDTIPGVVLPGRPVRPPQPWPEPLHQPPTAPGEHLGTYVRIGGMLNLQSKRGCPFCCVYCTYPRIEGRVLRLFEPAETATRAKELEEAGARFLFFTDNVFNSHHEHALAVAEGMTRQGVAIPWGAFFSPVRPPDGFYQRLAAAGLTHVEFGTDTLAEETLRRYAKPFTTEDVLAAHAQAVEAGLHVAHYLALGGPGETARTATETFDRLEGLERCALFFFFGLRIYPGTPLHAQALAEGQVAPGDDLLKPTFYRAPGVSGEELAAMAEKRARGRLNWVLAPNAAKFERLVSGWYRRGRTGPL